MDDVPCTGDDPSTAGVTETQVIDCTCTNEACAGTLQLSFKGKTTYAFPLMKTGLGLVEYRLEVTSFYVTCTVYTSCDNAAQELSTVQDVTVTIEQGTKFCSTGGSVTKIEFILPQGDVPDLVFTQSATFDATIALFSGGSASALLVSKRSSDYSARRSLDILQLYKHITLTE